MSRVMKTAPLVVLFALIIAVPSVWANWVQDGVALCTAAGGQGAPTITSDGAGGAIVTWFDNRSLSNYDIYAQRVNTSGTALWTTDGVALCTATGDQVYPTIISDGAGGAIVVWGDLRSANADLYAQRVNASGAVQWTANGVALCTSTGDKAYLQITSDGAGGAIVTWDDHRNGNSDIYAQRVNASGAVQWTANGVALCTAAGGQVAPTITSDGAGGAILTWDDNRSGNVHIYAQRVNGSGAVQWTADGVALCTAARDQYVAGITSDGAGGAIVTWQDTRSGSYVDIYAQRVNASGAAQWTTDGVALYTATGGSTESFQITSDGAGGAIVTWSENRSWDYDIYAQRVNASGAVQWTADGVALCTAARVQYSPQIVSDGAGGATVTWRDDRSGSNYDIYAQRVDALGAVQWTTDGVALCTATGDQGFPQITFDGVGGAIVSWYDYRSGNWDIYAQRVDAAGHTVVATLLQNYASSFSGDRIAITWTLSEIDEGIEFSVERATASDGPFIELPSSALRQDRLSFTFSDGDWQPNMSYWYRVEYQIDNERKVLFETGPIATPALPLTLYQNNPNPFNPSTTISYYIPEKCLVKLDVFDVVGARVARLVSSEEASGYHSVEWKGMNAEGDRVASGVYFYRLTAGKKTISRKMVLLQ